MINWLSDLLFWIFFVAILYSLRGQRIFWTVGALALLLTGHGWVETTTGKTDVEGIKSAFFDVEQWQALFGG